MATPSASSSASNIMLAIYEKKTVSLYLYCPLHNYIVFNYSEREAQNLEDDLQTLKQLHSDLECAGPADSFSSRRDLLQNYFKALTTVGSCFPISPYKDHINTVTFTWYDAFKSKLKASQQNTIAKGSTPGVCAKISRQRIFLIKFMTGEVLNFAIIRDHLDRCASVSIDLQQKLRSLTSEWKVLKFREEILVANLTTKKTDVRNGGVELGSDVLPSVLSNDGELIGKLPNRNNYISSSSANFVQLEDGQHWNGNNNYKQQCWSFAESVTSRI